MAIKNRVLSFIVEGQSIKKDPNCDFSGLVTGTKGFYQAKFTFGKEWKDYKKIAVFRNRQVTKYVPIMNGVCEIPDEVVDSMLYYVSIIGKSGSTSIPTIEVSVRQNKGGANG